MENGNIVIGRHARAKQSRARQLRHEMTPAESVLWQQLKDNRLGCLHFRRQQIIDGFIADFYCHAAGLIVEVDGSVHANQSDYDALRDKIISARGLQVLRISNTDIETNLECALAEILAIARQRLTFIATAQDKQPSQERNACQPPAEVGDTER
jgi:very-short-patch-repair endonuclease